MNVATLVFEAAGRHSDKAAIRHDKEFITYSDMAKSIKKMSHYLTHLGVERGDRIAIFSDKSIEYVVLIISALHIGAAYVPIDILYSFDFVSNILKSADPKILFCTNSYLDAIKKINHCDNVIDLDTIQSILEVDCMDDDIQPSDAKIACFLYTSGSTGDPKGVCVSHDNIIYFTQWCIREFQLKPTFRLPSTSVRPQLKHYCFER